MGKIKNVCVYCGSSVGSKPIFVEVARRLGTTLAREGIGLVYGGGGIGLMGAVARAAAEAGGHVTGVIPSFLVARERAYDGAREVIVTHDMHERKRIMFERADAFVTLPGGIGTLEELIEQLSWLQLGQHRKPTLILNLEGYWDPLLKLFGHMQEMKFLHAELNYLVTDRVEEVVPMLQEAARAIPEAELTEPVAKVAVERM